MPFSSRYPHRSTRLDPLDLVRLPGDGLLHLLLELSNLVLAEVVTCVAGDVVLLSEFVDESLALLEGLAVTLSGKEGANLAVIPRRRIAAVITHLLLSEERSVLRLRLRTLALVRREGIALVAHLLLEALAFRLELLQRILVVGDLLVELDVGLCLR